MVRRIPLAVAALLSTTAFAQGPMHDTWDINAPNGAPMVLGQPAPGAAAVNLARAPMQDTWDINAPNGTPSAPASVPVAASHDDPAVHGHGAGARQADRVIVVTPGMRSLSVRDGETVLFKVGGQSFTWTFDPTLIHGSFALAQIAPAGIDVGSVVVYCEPTPYERAG